MATKVKYIVVHNVGSTHDTVSSAEKVAELMLKGGEIVQSWVAAEAVHHLIKYEDPLISNEAVAGATNCR